ncbi:MAG: thioesterase family protein [Firmicutes bacterium]|nr:thioesterase family protein [Bacillota bacterium]
MLRIGLVGEGKTVVNDDNVALTIGSGSVSVFATPILVALMESAAVAAVVGQLTVGQTTVGTKIDVTHVAATPLGLTVTATAKLVEIDGRRLVFKVAAEDDSGSIGYGTHERYIVDRETFLTKAEQRKSYGSK